MSHGRLQVSMLDVARKTTAVKAVALVTAAAFVALTMWSPAPSVRAASPTLIKRVALFVFPSTNAAAGDAQVLQSFMRAELRKLVNVMSVAGQDESPAAAKTLILPSVERGYRALNERDAGAAQVAFDKAYQDITQYKGAVGKRLLARVLKGLGCAQVMNGLPEGSDTLNASLNVWPNQQIGDYGWTLDLRTAFNELINRRAQLVPGSIEVDTVPGGAAVRVDGELKGFSPVEVPELAAGQHWVETSIDGYRWSAMFVEVPSGDSSIHSVELEPTRNKRAFDAAVRSLERGVARRRADGPLGEMARATGADAVIALQVSARRGSYTLSGYVRDGRRANRITTEVAQDGAIADNLRKFLATTLGVQQMADDSELPLDGPPQTAVFSEGDLIIDPNDPIFSESKRREEEPVTSEWWFWAIVGGVTAGLVVGGIALFGSTDEGSGPAGNVLVDVNRLP